MITAYLADVGDGLAAGLVTLSGKRIQVDCGTQQDPVSAMRRGLMRIKPDIFMLSHFHVDHYNGLFAMHQNHEYRRYTNIRQVYFPRLPEFEDRERLALCLFTMNLRVMGNVTGSMEADFLNIISRINRNAFTYRSLAQGDTFNIDGSIFNVLWPPRFVGRTTLSVVKRSIAAFYQAYEQDEKTRRIYDAIKDSGIMRCYLNDDQQDKEFLHDYDSSNHYEEQLSRSNDLPEIVRKANDALRGAANHLSLAFMRDNRLLFLGDLEPHEIRTVARALKEQERLRFQVLITPHHGTHWHSDLAQINCISTISSVGPKLFKKSSPEYKNIAYECYVTHLQGDVELHFHSGLTHPFERLRGWYPHT